MDLKFAVICDNAFTDGTGRLNVIQIFEIIYAPKLPAIHPRLSIVTKYQLEKTDKNEFAQELEIVEGTKNKKIFEISRSIKSKPKNGKFIQFITNIVGIRFDAHGTYNVNLTLNGKKFPKATSFEVLKPPN